MGLRHQPREVGENHPTWRGEGSLGDGTQQELLGHSRNHRDSAKSLPERAGNAGMGVGMGALGCASWAQMWFAGLKILLLCVL